MKKLILLAVIVTNLCLISEVQARLVIVQDDEAKKAELAANKIIIEQNAIRKMKQAEAEERRAEQQAKIDKVKNATVTIPTESLNVIADRTERIIHHYGFPPSQLPAQGGAGLDSPMWIAINGIIPKGWKVYSDKKIDAQRRVSWNGHKANWVAVLYEMGVHERVEFDVDWNQHVVIVKPRVSDLDYLRDELQAKNQSREVNLTIKVDADQTIPEGGDGVLVINGKAVKVTRAFRTPETKRK